MDTADTLRLLRVHRRRRLDAGRAVHGGYVVVHCEHGRLCFRDEKESSNGVSHDDHVTAMENELINARIQEQQEINDDLPASRLLEMRLLPPGDQHTGEPARRGHLVLTFHLPTAYAELQLPSRAYVGKRCVDHLEAFAGGERVRRWFSQAVGVSVDSRPTPAEIDCRVHGGSTRMPTIHFSWRAAAAA